MFLIYHTTFVVSFIIIAVANKILWRGGGIRPPPQLYGALKSPVLIGLKNNTQQEENNKKCNCINKNQCPLNQQCLSIQIYINNLYKEKYYIGLCETTFKLRYANHKKSLNHEKYKNNTELWISILGNKIRDT